MECRAFPLLPVKMLPSLSSLLPSFPPSFLLNQTHSLSMSYDMVVKKELGLEEEHSVFATNLPVLPLHFLKVSTRVQIANSSLIPSRTLPRPRSHMSGEAIPNSPTRESPGYPKALPLLGVVPQSCCLSPSPTRESPGYPEDSHSLELSRSPVCPPNPTTSPRDTPRTPTPWSCPTVLSVPQSYQGVPGIPRGLPLLGVVPQSLS